MLDNISYEIHEIFLEVRYKNSHLLTSDRFSCAFSLIILFSSFFPISIVKNKPLSWFEVLSGFFHCLMAIEVIKKQHQVINTKRKAAQTKNFIDFANQSLRRVSLFYITIGFFMIILNVAFLLFVYYQQRVLGTTVFFTKAFVCKTLSGIGIFLCGFERFKHQNYY